MTDILLTVPFVSQLNIGGSPLAGGRHDPTGCWYAAISMLGYYREIGPRLGVPEQYVKPDGTPQKTDLGFQGGRGATASLAMGHNYEKLMKNEGLMTVPLPQGKSWSTEQLAGILTKFGPCYVRRGFIRDGKLTGGHAIVLVGALASADQVVVHDPWKGPNQKMSIAEFNRVFKFNDARAASYSMMYKPVASSRSHPVSELRKRFGGK
jgi:hypothetical protein